MHILCLVVYYPPIPNAAGMLMRDLARELIRCGHQVTVVTPSKCSHEAMTITDEDGITVIRVRTGEIRNANRVNRLWREAQLSRHIWRRGSKVFRENPCDLIVFYAPTIFFGDLVERLKEIWNCPSYLILRDIFPQWAVDAGVLSGKGMLYRYLRRKELQQYRVADVIGVQSRGDLAYFQDHASSQGKRVELLFNWIDSASKPTGSSRWRRELGLVDKVIFCYGGNIGVAQDMDNIVRLAMKLRGRDDCFILLVGEGSEVRRLNASIEGLGLTNIRILPPMEENAYLQCLSECDIGLISLDRRLRSHNFPGKLLGYTLCELPVLASINPGNDLRNVLEDGGAGICCVNGQDEKLCEAAQLLASQPQLRRRMGRNSYELSRTIFSTKAAAQQVIAASVPELVAAGTGYIDGAE